jgi:hypothetical protein
MGPIQEFYDIVDSDGNIVETAEEQAATKAEEVNKAEPEVTVPQLEKVENHPTVLPRVKACAHKLHPMFQPRMRNCQHCWYAWFDFHKEIVSQLDHMHSEGHDEVIKQLQGDKFYHRWRQYMSTMARLTIEQEQVTGE